MVSFKEDKQKEEIYEPAEGNENQEDQNESLRNSTKMSQENSEVKNQIKSFPDSLSKLTLNSEPPYLPSKSIMRNPRKFTLVLDLDETLVHFVEENDSAFIQIRPGAENFLEEMSKYYEIVIFTAAMQDVK